MKIPTDPTIIATIASFTFIATRVATVGTSFQSFSAYNEWRNRSVNIGDKIPNAKKQGVEEGTDSTAERQGPITGRGEHAGRHSDYVKLDNFLHS
jgi:hypothetical protein